MDVNTRNQMFARGEIDREDLWPKILEYEGQSFIFRFQFGLDELPKEPGIITIRGPRQYGKSTWLELALRDTLQDFGKGSAFFLNGDDITDADDLEKKIHDTLNLFNPRAKVRRLFIDEISAIHAWEKALKRLADRGELRDVLIVTTGSKATDLRRAAERLPGRKGKLQRTQYIFTGISYKDFHSQCHRQFKEKTWIAYLLSGGSPIAAKELSQFERIPDYFYEINRDWILGELIKVGRSRPFVLALMRALHARGGSRMGYLNLAKAAGMANNTIASEYIEQLSDLLSVIPSFQWDADHKVPIQRKPSKFHFVNLSVALAFYDDRLATVADFEKIPKDRQAVWIEWLVAQELFRRQCIRGLDSPEAIYYWASKNHEIDFVDAEQNYLEIKLGKSSPQEFSWFSTTIPGKKLLVIEAKNQGGFETPFVKAITLEQFLLADGFPHPYPGEVDDPDIYNEFAQFSKVD